MKTVERHKKTDFGDVWYVNAADGTYRFAVYKYDDDQETIYLSNVFVKEDSRRQGYGNEILTSAEEYANRLGASVICLKVLSGSDVHRWYKRHGYEDLEKDEEERGYMWMKKDLKKVNESVWVDMHRRSDGRAIRKEDDIPFGMGDVLLTYIGMFSDKLHNTDDYELTLGDFISFIRDFSHDERVKGFNPDIPGLIAYVKAHWDDSVSQSIQDTVNDIDMGLDNIAGVDESVWTDMHKRSNGYQVRKEDDVNLLDLDEFYKYIKDKYKTKVEYIDLDAMGGGNGDVLGVDITEDIILFYKPKRGHILLSWSRVKIPMPFLDKLTDRFKVEHPNVMRRIITEKDGSCTNKTFIDVIDFFLEHKNSLINESVWSDMHKRSNGEQVRKEDEITQTDMDAIVDSMNEFATRVVWDNEKFSREKFCECVRNYLKFNKEVNIENIIKYIDSHWTGDIEKDIEGFIEEEEKEKNNGMNESIWSDIHKRSNGEQVRKEDEMNTDDFLMLRETAKMFRVGVRNYANPKNRKYAPRRIDGCDGFIDYILERKKEHFWSDIPDEVYDKVIKFVKDNWGDCTGIQEFMDKYLSDINECDGVPGGITPADVGGMGEITFPGTDGTPGSGDIPMPTGVVYQQVAPYTMFLKQIKKKKRKKKFRKEDEPCAHSPNAKVYDYVDDYREYVDRTYNNMDRK